MIAALSVLIPLSAGGAISPMMFTEQIVLLGTRGPRAAWQFALGATLALLVIVVLLVFVGSIIELPSKPTLSASLDIVLGGVLVVLGASIEYVGRHPLRRRKRPEKDPENASGVVEGHAAAFPFGVFSMVTNFTTIAVVTVAAKQIAAAKTDTPGRIFLVAFLVAVCSFPAWAPPLTTKLSPTSGQRLLETLRRLITDHGRQAVAVLVVLAGLYLLAKGIFNVSIDLSL
ncbi:hypothetical protein HJD18_08990 [Thermoleophilia bacterium SCSIO 60948]|nr:hypothetical protein HJD18_08990 [Thermoleophilia bacterium SCSIO 60948]